MNIFKSHINGRVFEQALREIGDRINQISGAGEIFMTAPKAFIRFPCVKPGLALPRFQRGNFRFWPIGLLSGEDQIAVLDDGLG